MGFTKVAFKELVVKINQSIDGLLSYHKKKSIAELKSEERKIQAQFLLKIIENLKDQAQIPDTKKTIILNAAVYYVHSVIKSEYYARSPEWSTFFGSLSTSLGITNNNVPLDSDLEEFYSSLVEYIRTNVYCNPNDTTSGYLKKQIFEGLNIESYLSDLTTKLHNVQLRQIENAKKAHENPDKYPGFFKPHIAGNNWVNKPETAAPNLN